MRENVLKSCSILLATMLVTGTQTCQAQSDDLANAIQAIKQVDKDGVGHEAAIDAMTILNSADVEQVPQILAGMDGANQLAVNWLRSAVISIVSRSDRIPVAQVKTYFEDKEGSHLGRLMAFDMLMEADAGWAESMVPEMIDDPSLPLRRKAIKSWITKSESAEPTTSLGLLTSALEKARDVDQVEQIAKLLDEKGIAIDLQKQLGFLNSWRLLASFDNKNESGFDIVYGPETTPNEVDVAATYTDMNSQEVKWSSHSTVEPTGIVDLNEAIGKVKGAVAYATTTFNATEDADCEVRIGCINAHKVWVNGELILSNEIYHNGMSPDKFSAPAKLKKGDNRILVKICQNEQTEPWAQRWQFQLRICDETGKAIQPAAPAPAAE